MTFKLLSNRSSGSHKERKSIRCPDQQPAPWHEKSDDWTGSGVLVVGGRLGGRQADQKSVNGSKPLQIGPRIPAERPALPARKKTAIGGAVQSGTYYSLNATPLNAETPATPDAATWVKAP